MKSWSRFFRPAVARGQPFTFPFRGCHEAPLCWQFTSSSVTVAAERLLQPEALHFVVVGQPQGLEPSN